jgi:hypothetical protein
MKADITSKYVYIEADHQISQQISMMMMMKMYLEKTNH